MPRRRPASTTLLGTGVTMHAEQPQEPHRGVLGPDQVFLGAEAESDALAPILAAMSERDFQLRHVVDGLRRRGFVVWTVPDMRRTTAGLPDVLAYHPRIPGLLLAHELKRSSGRLTDKQRQALRHLQTVPGIDARIVRPQDWPRLRDALDSADPIAALDGIPRE